MHIFVNQKIKKVNFIDDQNHVIGFDIEVRCCEKFGWVITGEPFLNVDLNLIYDIVKSKLGIAMIFNTTDNESIDGFLKNDIAIPSIDIDSQVYHKSDGVVIFRLIDSTNPKRHQYLHLFNFHNGYYTHGIDLIEILFEHEI